MLKVFHQDVVHGEHFTEILWCFDGVILAFFAGLSVGFTLHFGFSADWTVRMFWEVSKPVVSGYRFEFARCAKVFVIRCDFVDYGRVSLDALAKSIIKLRLNQYVRPISA